MTESCPHCGQIHKTTCHRIKAIEYNSDGTLKRIEFHAPQPVVVDLQPKHSSVVVYRSPLETMWNGYPMIST